MELHQLRYFVAVAETGSVSRAAVRCHVAQPSLSQQLRKLETGLGARLFDRVGRGMLLTDTGRALLPRARRILAEVRDVEHNLERDIHEGVGALVVGAIPTMAPYLVPPAVDHVRRSMPGCDISVREEFTDPLIELVASSEVDCAIVSTPIEHERIVAEVIGSEPLLVVAPADQQLCRTPEVALDQLRGKATVALEELHCLAQQIQGFCAAHRIAPRVSCQAAQLATVVELVALGLGISIIPEMAAAAHNDQRVRYAPLADDALRREVAIAWRKDRTRGRAGVAFAEAVRQVLKSERVHLPGRSPEGRRRKAASRA